MAIQVRRNGVWVDNTGEKKRVNSSWVSNEPYKVMKPTISGVPPFTFKSDGENLRDWSMSGQTVQASTPTPSSPVAVEGVGEKTGNLFEEIHADWNINSSNTVVEFDTPGTYKLALARVESGQTYTTTNGRVYAFFSEKPKLGSVAAQPRSTDYIGTITAPITGWVAIRFSSSTENLMLNAGSTALPYEPYGVKIPITCGGTTTNIYLDAPLMDGDTISKSSTGVNIPTVNGSNTLTVGTTVQPSEMTIESISQWV